MSGTGWKRLRVQSLAALIVAAGLLAAACGGATTRASTAPSEGQPAAAPTSTAVSQPLSAAAPNTAAPPSVGAPSGAGATEEDLFTLGEHIFKEAAAPGVGCQACHGPEAKGNIGPNIRGKSPGQIRLALQDVDPMSFIHLDEHEIEAVSTYLKWLATQP